MNLRVPLLTIFCGAATIAPLAASPILTLAPVNGALTGAPGDTVGWGFGLQNNSADTLTITSSFLINETNSSVGSYSDIISYAGGPANAMTQPQSNWTQSFGYNIDPALSTGVGAFFINTNAPNGAIDSAQLVIAYELDTIAGNFDSSGVLTAPVSVEVASPTPAPEPSLSALIGFAVAGLWLARRSTATPRRKGTE